MALIKSCLASAGGGYNVTRLYDVSTVGRAYYDVNVTADVGDYLALSNAHNGSAISGTGITETSEISITGARKIYKVTSALNNATLRVNSAENSGGTIVQIRPI